MTGYLYSRHTLCEFREGICGLFRLMEGLFEDERTHVDLSTLMKQLGKVDQNEWVAIRRQLELAEINTTADSSLTKSEPVQLFMELITKVNHCQTGIATKLEEIYSKEEEFKKDIKALEEKLQLAESVADETRHLHNQDKKELGTTKAMMAHLQDLVDQKNEKINDLQRGGTVQIWEKEKVRVLEKELAVHKELNDKIMELKLENERLKKTIKNSQKSDLQSAKLDRLREEERKRQSQDELEQENDELKRKVYTMERDLMKAEGEVFKSQKYVIGCLQGLKRDFKIVIERLMGEKGILTFDELSRKDISSYKAMMDKILEAVQTGKLGILRADLPEHYIALDTDVQGTSMRRLSVQYNRNVRLVPISPLTAEDKREIKDGSLPTLPSHLKTTLNLRASNVSAVSPIKEEEDKDEKKDEEPSNPVVINEKTGQVNHIMLIRHFPHFSKTYIQQQWELFQQYDTSGDLKLDLTELVTAMNQTIGDKFAVEEIKDAMNEVDLDQNQEIDFFEYLKVADMLMHKAGQADIFKSGYIQTQGRTISKTCTVS